MRKIPGAKRSRNSGWRASTSQSNCKHCGSRTRRFNTINIKIHHRTRFWASSIHLPTSKPISLRSVLVSSTNIRLFLDIACGRFLTRILYAVLSSPPTYIPIQSQSPRYLYPNNTGQPAKITTIQVSQTVQLILLMSKYFLSTCSLKVRDHVSDPYTICYIKSKSDIFEIFRRQVRQVRILKFARLPSRYIRLDWLTKWRIWIPGDIRRQDLHTAIHKNWLVVNVLQKRPRTYATKDGARHVVSNSRKVWLP
jgi:hypothetical protein